MQNLLRTSLMTALVAGLMVFAAAGAKADPVTITTSGTFSGSGNDTITLLCGIGCTTTLTFNGASSSVFTPAGAQFGELLVMSTAGPSFIGAAITGNFALNFFETSVGSSVLVGTLSGTLHFDGGIGTLTFSTTSVNIGGIIFTVAPSYTVQLPVTRAGDPGTAATTIQGTGTPSAMPEPASMLLLGTGLAGVAAAVRRKMRARHQN